MGQSTSDRSSDSASSISASGYRGRVEVHEAICRERAAAQRGIADPRGGAGGELSVLHATLDPSAEAHQRGQAEVDRGLEGIVVAASDSASR